MSMPLEAAAEAFREAMRQIDVAGQAEVALPIGGQRDCDEMRARGLAPQIEPVRVAAELGGIPVYPSNGAADLIGEHHQVATDILHPGEVRYDIMRPGGEEHLGRTCEILRTSAAP